MPHDPTIHVYAHADPDGYASAAIVKSMYPKCFINLVTYGKAIPNLESIRPGDTVFVLDFSFPLEQMKDIASQANLIWIDHHDAVIQDYDRAGFNPKGIRDSSVAACVSTFKYLFPNKPIPKSIQYVGAWDIWQLTPDVIAMHYAMDMVDLRPYAHGGVLWDKLLMDDPVIMDNLMAKGHELREFIELVDSIQAKDTVYRHTLPNGKVLAMTNAKIGSSLSLFFQSYKEPCDYHVIYGWNAGMNAWKYSAFSNHSTANACTLAMQFGGKGHAAASGWVASNLCFPQGSTGIEPVKENIFKPIQEYCAKSQIANVYLLKEFKSMFQTRGFIADWYGFKAYAVNYDTDSMDLFVQGDTRDTVIGVTFTWTACGKYRITVRPLKPAVTLDDLYKKIPKDMPIFMHNGSLWYYTDTLPFNMNRRPSFTY